MNRRRLAGIVLFFRGNLVDPHQDLMDELLDLERLARAWFDAGHDVRHALYREFADALREFIGEMMSPERLPTINLFKVLAYDALWQCPDIFALTVYPVACSASFGSVNLAPVYKLYQTRLAGGETLVPLVFPANSNRRTL